MDVLQGICGAPIEIGRGLEVSGLAREIAARKPGGGKVTRRAEGLESLLGSVEPVRSERVVTFCGERPRHDELRVAELVAEVGAAGQKLDCALGAYTRLRGPSGAEVHVRERVDGLCEVGVAPHRGCRLDGCTEVLLRRDHVTEEEVDATEIVEDTR